jgi:diguanylate cyclase (GGDEF)-like protein/PAS domain S-box-containing protein
VITALFDAEQNVAGYGLISSDMSAHRLAYRELRDSEERFRCAFDESPIGMVMCDVEGRYERVNDAFCAIVGYESERLSGLLSKEITHPDDIAVDKAAAHALLAGNAKSRSYEKRYLHAAGHVVWTSFDITLLCKGRGRSASFVAQIQDITKHRMYQRQLEYMADHDALTGLLNRRGFQRELESHIARIGRYGLTGSILMIDLDNFKVFNDRLGHAAGDRLLVDVARGLESRLRESDVLARLGGDEFAVLLPYGDDPAMRRAAEALLGVVRDLPSATAWEQSSQVTASIGIARFDETATTAEEIMVNADVAMYEAKEAGRNRASLYRSELRDLRMSRGI